MTVPRSKIQHRVLTEMAPDRILVVRPRDVRAFVAEIDAKVAEIEAFLTMNGIKVTDD